MLDQLPHEVFLAILSFLTLQDKLIFIRTCQQFFNLISKTSLYSELNILKHPRQQEEIIGKFINSRYPGSQVKKLYFNIDSISDQLLFRLSTIFPNMTSVSPSRFTTGNVMCQDRYTKGPMLQWSKTLQTLDLMYEWPEGLSIIKITTFPRLTDIRLSRAYKFDDSKQGFDTCYFLPVFKNVPSLKRLSLDDCALNLEILEEIHASCPHLEELVLDNTHINIAKEYTLPSTVLPANSLLSLTINDTFCFDTNGLLLEYVTRKYRYLKNLHLQLEWNYKPRFFNNYYGVVLDASHYNDGAVQGIIGYVPMFRYLDSENNTMDVYRESGPTFFSNLTTTIQSITIDNHLFNNLLQDMANSNCQPRRLRLLNKIVDPLQMLCIKNLNKLKSLELECRIPDQIYSHHISYTSITKLYIRLCNKTVYIDWFLRSFPSLEEFEIDGRSNLTTTENANVGINQSSNLYKLSVRRRTLSQACLDALRLAAPNMRELNLRARAGQSNTNINISDWDLKVLNLDTRGKASFTLSLYRIITPNCTKVMKYNRSDPSLVVVKNSSRFCLDKMVSIQSSREKQFKFNGFSILLSIDNVTIDYEK